MSLNMRIPKIKIKFENSGQYSYSKKYFNEVTCKMVEYTDSAKDAT